MTNREKHWQHFVQSGNPISYIAYRQQAKKDDITPRALRHNPHQISHHAVHHNPHHNLHEND